MTHLAIADEGLGFASGIYLPNVMPQASANTFCTAVNAFGTIPNLFAPPITASGFNNLVTDASAPQSAPIASTGDFDAARGVNGSGDFNDALLSMGNAYPTIDDASNTIDDASSTIDDASGTIDDASGTMDDVSRITGDTSSTTDDASNAVGDKSLVSASMSIVPSRRSKTKAEREAVKGQKPGAKSRFKGEQYDYLVSMAAEYGQIDRVSSGKLRRFATYWYKVHSGFWDLFKWEDVATTAQLCSDASKEEIIESANDVSIHLFCILTKELTFV